MSLNRPQLQAAARHQNKLTTLLVTKFVNKFKITTQEPDLLLLVREEIEHLLTEGSATEAKLNQIDRKLETSIKFLRDERLTPSMRAAEEDKSKSNN